MKYRRLGRSGLEVSVVGIGTYQLGGEWVKVFTQREVDAILGAAGDCGINLIYTAECYGDHLAEQLVGDYLTNEELLTDRLTELLELEAQAGKIRHIGISIKQDLCRCSDTFQVQKAPELNVQVIQILYNRLEGQTEKGILPLCQELDLGVIARAPLASGLRHPAVSCVIPGCKSVRQFLQNARRACRT